VVVCLMGCEGLTFGVAWDGAIVARWSANPVSILWPEVDAAFVMSGGGGPPP
jgi:hypothetical protein